MKQLGCFVVILIMLISPSSAQSSFFVTQPNDMIITEDKTYKLVWKVNTTEFICQMMMNETELGQSTNSIQDDNSITIIGSDLYLFVGINTSFSRIGFYNFTLFLAIGEKVLTDSVGVTILPYIIDEYIAYNYTTVSGSSTQYTLFSGSLGIFVLPFTRRRYM
ncbi:MAG: hypothetical protein INQ03_16495 [Candidatus Heimdallarchaeota archaeon]|nr:hypothetical protein [Candidatus Heimdallarchaeota archaeon]